jgi:hypothetical protein
VRRTAKLKAGIVLVLGGAIAGCGLLIGDLPGLPDAGTDGGPVEAAGDVFVEADGKVAAGEASADGAADAESIEASAEAEASSDADAEVDSGPCGDFGEQCCASATCGGALVCKTGIYCGSGQAFCDGACLDVLADNANCGACGVSCRGVCAAGGCLLPLASGQNKPIGIAVDSKNVYWASLFDGNILMVPKGGAPDGGGPTILASGQNFPAAEAGSPVLVAYGLGATVEVAFDNASIYWTAFGDGNVVELTPK